MPRVPVRQDYTRRCSHFCLDRNQHLGYERIETKVPPQQSAPSSPDEPAHHIKMGKSDRQSVVAGLKGNGSPSIFVMGKPGTPVHLISRNPEEEIKPGNKTI